MVGDRLWDACPATHAGNDGEPAAVVQIVEPSDDVGREGIDVETIDVPPTAELFSVLLQLFDQFCKKLLRSPIA